MKLTHKHLLAALAAIPLLALPLHAADGNEADNTKTNERDKSGDTKTPLDQSNAPEDLKITQNIRQAVMKDDSLSTSAKNVKIITTAGGLVTLRGPVNTAEEKSKIEALATDAAGKDKVTNQLEVKTSDNK